MTTVFSVLFTLILFSDMSSHFLTIAMPATKVDDGRTDQDSLGFLLGDEPMTEPVLVPRVYRQSLMLDNNVRDEDKNTRLIMPDMRLRGHSIRGMNPAFIGKLPLLTDQSLRHIPDEYSLKVDRRDTDIDILRCMIGRVYRPCWEV
ncbi:pro-MCH [Mastacembelus armatus]|uniref:pro-MCH n=1 Tax=Mastacembelus armatus TaxID=205130 RepID=UPI000E45AD78|nr:pro-MCH 2-like [Mastacembelus armatus]